MISDKKGVLANQQIKWLIQNGHIRCANTIEPEQIQPASIDLRLGKRAWRVPASFLLSKGGTVQDKLDEYAIDYFQFSIENGAFLEARKTYVFELQESLALPEHIKARSNPKSSTGRVDTFARLISDHCTNFDNIPAGYQGKLYLLVHPMSFDLKIREGLSLNQLRFSTIGNSHRLNTEELIREFNEHQLLFDKEGNSLSVNDVIIDDGGLFLSLDLSDDIIGYRSKKNAKPIDLSKIAYHEIHEYWEPINRPPNGKLILDPDFFYILKSKEKIRIPTNFACEMVDFHSGIGEFRSHYAGFFDPGFGYGISGEISGSHAVLEVRMRDSPMEVIDGQIFVKMVFERMQETPTIAYGVHVKSNYQNQGLKLGKHFCEKRNP